MNVRQSEMKLVPTSSTRDQEANNTTQSSDGQLRCINPDIGRLIRMLGGQLLIATLQLDDETFTQTFGEELFSADEKKGLAEDVRRHLAECLFCQQEEAKDLLFEQEYNLSIEDVRAAQPQAQLGQAQEREKEPPSTSFFEEADERIEDSDYEFLEAKLAQIFCQDNGAQEECSYTGQVVEIEKQPLGEQFSTTGNVKTLTNRTSAFLWLPSFTLAAGVVIACVLFSILTITVWQIAIRNPEKANRGLSLNAAQDKHSFSRPAETVIQETALNSLRPEMGNASALSTPQSIDPLPSARNVRRRAINSNRKASSAIPLMPPAHTGTTKPADPSLSATNIEPLVNDLAFSLRPVSIGTNNDDGRQTSRTAIPISRNEARPQRGKGKGFLSFMKNIVQFPYKAVRKMVHPKANKNVPSSQIQQGSKERGNLTASIQSLED